MAATVEQIKSLRQLTGAGIMDCKDALEKSDGNQDKAVDLLREKGFSQAAKRSGRDTTEGVVEAYIHNRGRVGAMVELGCETDFVARTPEFKELAHNIAMQVAAMNPAYIAESDIAEDDNRPPAEVTLLLQSYIKNSSMQVGDVVKELAAKVGENVKVVRFSRLALED
ncbi:MAG: translation elongation factor Ts [Chloroflexi bacterium]|nr:translation elongation factor Ts [Chloroflexota bacterium]MDA1218108.1 translation elongation factor Ts [Chloroflexota bacterium]